MRESFLELVQYRHLLLMLTWKDIRIRYKQSVMGFLWALLMPLLIVLSGVVVKKAFSMLSGVPLSLTDIASVSVKALPWAFFIGSIRFATNSLTGNSNLVTKIYFPREVFPISAVLANLFDFVIASLALTVLLTIARIGGSIYLIWLPLILILLILLTLAIGMLLSCANLFFRDVKYLVEILLTFGIFFTPVFYEAKMFGNWAFTLMLNPVSPLLEALNDVVVRHRPPDFLWLSYAAAWAFGGFLIAWAVFKKAEYLFAENI